MDWSTARHDYRPAPRPEPPAPELLETRWRVKGPSGKVITCAIYKTTADYIELRVGYSFDHLLRSQLVGHIDAGRALASEWLEAIRALGSWEELPTEP